MLAKYVLAIEKVLLHETIFGARQNFPMSGKCDILRHNVTFRKSNITQQNKPIHHFKYTQMSQKLFLALWYTSHITSHAQAFLSNYWHFSVHLLQLWQPYPRQYLSSGYFRGNNNCLWQYIGKRQSHRYSYLQHPKGTKLCTISALLLYIC